MDAYELARELGEKIYGSEELKRLKTSDALLLGDKKAMTLFDEFRALQKELLQASKDKLDKDSMNGIKERLITKQQELYDYNTTNEYLEAKSAFDKYMKTINDIINFSINGSDGCTPDKCGSCNGCS